MKVRNSRIDPVIVSEHQQRQVIRCHEPPSERASHHCHALILYSSCISLSDLSLINMILISFHRLETTTKHSYYTGFVL